VEQRIYANFDLLFEAGIDEGYRVRVVASPAGEATGTFLPPFTEAEFRELLRRISGPDRRQRRLESDRHQTARLLGDGLFQALFAEDVGRCYRASLGEVERRGEGLRIRLRLSDVPELIEVPWELLHDPQSDAFLALSVWTPIVRYLELPVPIKSVSATPPLRILVMISQPPSLPLLDVETEWGRLQQAVGEIEAEGLVSVTRLPDATLMSLQRALRDDEFHIFHFVGHGGYDSGHDDGILVLEDGAGGERMASGRDLGAFLRDQRSLRLVVLNSCSGATTSRADPFTGAAQSLVLAGMPSVVAMQSPISDPAAISFTSEFYSAIGHRHGVDTAIGEARRAMFGLGNDTEWATPVLYMRAPDGAIFDIAPAPPGSKPKPAPAARGGSSPPRSRKSRADERTRRGQESN
jgi:hypothetical protein